MLSVHRFRVADPDAFEAQLAQVVEALAARPGFLDAEHGSNVDEPDLWVLVTRWADVGSYRRGIGSYEAKVALAAVMGEMLHEPSAYDDESGKP